MTIKKLKQSGDTIVEVLISVTIISMVITGAYVASSKNLTANQASQERGEALKIAESQLENIKARSPNDPDFCYDSSNTIATSSTGPLPALNADNFSTANYPATCKQGTDSRYNIFVSKPAASKTYTVYVRWDRIGGGNKQEVKLVYRSE